MRRRRLVVLGTLWVAVAIAGVSWVAITVPGDIEDRTREALAGSGVAAEVDGRDVTLYGDVDPAVEELVLGVDGVRTVRWSSSGAAGPATTEPAPTTEATSTTTPPPATEPAATEPATTEAPIADDVLFRASLEQGQLTLQGAVASPEAAAGVAAAADLIYFPLISSSLVEDAEAPGGPWVAGLPQAVSVLPITGTATIEISADTVVITGTTGSEEKKALLEGALRQALGDSLAYDNQVEVTGLAPPQFVASSSGDGTVVLGGVMPDQDSIDLIAGAAAEAYGPDGVDNQMAIDTGVEATFSVYRIPFIFAPLSLIPQWDLDITNDVITGALRGGASFAYDSAELTPQLQQLATIAAGIMARNPTVTATIEGHTDSDGSAAYNLDLSQRRANAARDFIVALGVAPERMVATGLGETSPVADNDTDAGREANRRIDFALGPLEGGG